MTPAVRDLILVSRGFHKHSIHMYRDSGLRASIRRSQDALSGFGVSV